MLLHQRNHDAIIGGRGLQFTVEIDAKASPQGQAPSAVDAVAPGRVNDQLHASRLVEKALRHDLRLCRNASQNRSGFSDIADNLFGDCVRDTGYFRKPALRLAGIGKSLVYFTPELGDRRRKFPRARRRLAKPKRDARRQTLSILDPNLARADPPNPPRPIA